MFILPMLMNQPLKKYNQNKNWNRSISEKIIKINYFAMLFSLTSWFKKSYVAYVAYKTVIT